MKKSIPAASPDAYVDGLSGWQRVTVERLRAAVVAGGKLDEVIKWGHLVYLSNGPVLLIRAEDHRVLLGFWRGQRLREIETRTRERRAARMRQRIGDRDAHVGQAEVREHRPVAQPDEPSFSATVEKRLGGIAR